MDNMNATDVIYHVFETYETVNITGGMNATDIIYHVFETFETRNARLDALNAAFRWVSEAASQASREGRAGACFALHGVAGALHGAYLALFLA